jgi:hypothetical protein
MMHSNMKNCALVSLFIICTIGLPLGAVAQSAKLQGEDRVPARAVPSQVEIQESAKASSDAELERNQRLLDRELVRMRQQLENEALNRMRSAGAVDRDNSGFERAMRYVMPFLVFLVLTSVVLWLVRVALDNRRWYRMVKVQTEIHTKLLDRFTANEDMVAYMQSEAGKRFLESPRFDIQPQQAAAFPYGRILWSAQVGLIAATVGGGLLFLRGRVPHDGDVPLLVFGTLALMIALGFLLSAAAAYGLSRHFGLLAPARPTDAAEANIRHS